MEIFLIDYSIAQNTGTPRVEQIKMFRYSERGKILTVQFITELYNEK